MGRIHEALRHCRLAEALLENEPNSWVLGGSLLNRACISSLNCEFDEAAKHIASAREAYAASGDVHGLAINSSLAFIQVQTGRFDEAQRTLATILSHPEIDEARKRAARETSARLHLVLNQLDECSRQLEAIRADGGHDIGVPSYIARWAGITNARQLMRRTEFREALDGLVALERSAKESFQHDASLSVALNLTAAQALARLGNLRDAANRVWAASEADANLPRDLKGHYYYCASSTLGDSRDDLALQMKQRAIRLWASQSLMAARLEVDDSPVEPSEVRSEFAEAKRTIPVMSRTVECVTNALAAVVDLAHNPHLIGLELASAIRALGCAAELRSVDRSTGTTSSSSGTVSLELGETSSHLVFIECAVPADPAKALLLSDVFRIGRAAVALEKARQEERSRAAIWPATPIEEQAGALFVAEEMQALLAAVRRVATTNIPILITGETGTGKEVVARLIHGYSPRAARTFLPFNLTATPRDMLDAQLFGHRRGAFTGATEHFSGVIRAAAGGTLFLDEIGESTLDVQPKLLRFLESGEVHPIGDAHPQRVDVRVIAATNADLETLVSEGRFREDLFYRLNIVRLHVPPLRERRVDIPAFANLYLQKYAAENGKGDLRLSEETMEYLLLYRWPGNVRQLANEMRRLVALAEPGAVLMPEHLSQGIAASRKTVPASERTLEASEVVVRTDQPLAAAVQHVERTMVQRALAKATSVDEAARMLGLSRKGLYLKRLRFGLEIDRPRGEVEVA